MIEGSELAVLVAGKVCHDMFEPLNAMVQGLELSRSEGADRTEAGALLEQSVNKMWAKLDFFRFAVSSARIEGDASLSEMREILQKLYRHLKPDFVWSAGEMTLPRPAMCVVANLALIIADCAARGGRVELVAENGEARLIATGPKASLRPDIAKAFNGDIPAAEVRSYAVLPTFTGQIAREAGVTLSVREGEERVELIARSQAFALQAAA